MPRRTKSPSKGAIRDKILERIAEADLPKDAGQFTLLELEQNGFCAKYPRKDLSPCNYIKFVLLATQAKELRRQRDGLKAQLGRLQPYHSPLWDKAYDTVDPLERAKLRKEAESDEEKVRQERLAKKKSEESEWDKLVDAFSKRNWRRRDKSSRPRGAYLWHEPMTWVDYHHATGLSRKTVENTLKRIGAKPILEKRRVNEPSRYGPSASLGLLADWLIRHVKNAQDRRAWLAQTLLKYRHEAPQHFDEVAVATWPVFESLGVVSKEQIHTFRDYVNAVDRELYPPQLAPSSPNGTTIEDILSQIK